MVVSVPAAFRLSQSFTSNVKAELLISLERPSTGTRCPAIS
jgi:hypothetical protein